MGRCGEVYQNAYVPRGFTGKCLVVTTQATTEEERERVYKLCAGSFTRSDIAFVPSIRCNPKGRLDADKPVAIKKVRACRSYVIRAIEALKPVFIIGMGKTAFRSLTNTGGSPNIIEFRGRPIQVPTSCGVYLATLTFDIEYSPGRSGYIAQDFARLLAPPLERPEDGTPSVTQAVAVDSEFDPEGKLLDLSVASSTRASTISADMVRQDSPAVGAIDSARILVGHSVMTEVDQLAKLGLAKPGWVSGEDTLDSLLLARLSDENRGKGAYGVETLLLSEFNAEPWKHKTEEYSETDATTWPVDLRQERCRLDAWASAVLTKHFLPKAKGPVKLIHRMAASLHRLQYVGAYIDLEVYDEIAGKLSHDMLRYGEILQRTAASVGMTEFSPTNDGHVRELLYDRLGLPPGETTETGEYKVDKVTLRQHADNEVVNALARYSSAEKLHSVNVTGFSEYLQRVPAPWGEGQAGFVPVKLNPFGARTGRRSSSDPNWQNWRKSMRRMVRSRWKGGMIGDHDYSRLEVVLLAYFAKDDKLYDVFVNGDGYVGVGKELWGRDIVQGTDEYRATKSTILGVQYGMRGYKLGMQLWHGDPPVRLDSNLERHIELADELREKYLAKFPGIKRFMAERRQELIRTGQVVAKTGVVRRLPCPDGQDTPGFGHMINEAINFPIQHFASMVTGSALVDIESALCTEHGISLTEYHRAVMERRWPEMAMIWNEVHDDVPVDFFPGSLKRDQEIVVETMRTLPTLRKMFPDFDIQLKVGVELSTHWCGK